MAEPNQELQDLVQQVGIVRRWLVVTARLKSTVLALGVVVAYVTLFTLLDYWCHFHFDARILILVLFVVTCAIVGRWLVSRFTMKISFGHAAEHIESQQNFYRQLVTAMEYYDNRQHYAYSRSLAHLLIRQIHGKTEDLDFRGFVNRWPAFGRRAHRSSESCGGLPPGTPAF